MSAAQALAAVQAATKATLGTSVEEKLLLQLPHVGKVTGRGEISLTSGNGFAQLIEPGGTEQIIFHPPDIYDQPTNSGTSPVRLPSGKSWIVDDPTDGNALGFRLLTLQLEAANPAFWLTQLSWGAVSASPTGPSFVNGAPAQGYQVSIDLNRAEAHSAGPLQTTYAAVIGFEQSQLGSQPMVTSAQVWVAGGQIVELSYAPAGVPAEQATATFTASGVTVTGQVPDASQTVDVGADKDR